MVPYQYCRFNVKRKKRIHTSLPAIKDHCECRSMPCPLRDETGADRDCTCESTKTVYWMESMRNEIGMLRHFYGHIGQALPPILVREKKWPTGPCGIILPPCTINSSPKARMSPRSQEYTSTTMFSILSLKTLLSFLIKNLLE